MIKIISISNAHAWDGKELTQNTFNALIHVLHFTGWTHTVEYEKEGKKEIIHI